MQVLQGVEYPKRGANVEMKRAMAQRREVHQQHFAMGFLQRNRDVDCDRGRP